MNYQIFIDETGNFAKKIRVNRNTDFVAGWVCQENFTFKLKKLLEKTVFPFNKEIKISQGSQFTLKIPDHLHFIPLHIKEFRKKKDTQIKVPVSKVRDIVSSIFNAVEKDVLLVFRSYGFPRYYVNEQASYTEILKAAILQLIDDIDYKPQDSIKIIIAARRIQMLMGEFGYDNIKVYEQYFCSSLKNEIRETFKSRKISNLDIVIEDARESAGLAMADLFCGSQRWKDFDYLEQYREKAKIKQYCIHNALLYIPNRTVSRIEYIYENDPVTGLMQGFAHLAQNPENIEVKNTVSEMCRKFPEHEVPGFAAELRSWLHEKLVEDYYRYQNLDFADQLMNQVGAYFSSKLIWAVLQKYRIKINNHRGRTDTKQVEDYLDFLEKYGSEIFGSMYIADQERVETILSIIQPAAFNIFKFEDAEPWLSREIGIYESLYPDRNGMLDETRAKLEGSTGQLYGFLADYPETRSFYEDAEYYLKKDVQHCVKYSRAWFQALGYLTSLYFKKENLEKAVESFIRETRSENQKESDIYDLRKTDLFLSSKGDFFLLHRLYLCAAALKQGIDVSGEQNLGKMLLSYKSKNQYPVFLAVKWMGVICALKGNLELALELFQSIDTKPSKDFTIDVIKLPIKILAHAAACKLGKKSVLNLDKDLNRFEKQVKGIKHNLAKLGIKNYAEYDDSWDFYKIARLMPFYYS
ncbi:Uncharacterized protein dnl_25500 [Desulfonema limicola]|uniref:DUF3800 domain-containing protein n=1 Tax=Desulfonema limicola TaxID=45656 RepID=A0A975B7D9_9BACT|nr:hypothetical protein [Desulfonema limicola]QTA80254.1 Uncharacterized protein dnl_25500 [Desulfonema limicola]